MNIEHIHTLFLKSTGVCTDTRTITQGNIFVALKGPNFNGNLYAQVAIEKGASYAIVDEEVTFDGKGLQSQIIRVEDALKSLQELSNYHRRFLKTPIIGITGSNGKTTTKELLASVLVQNYNIQYTKGNLNNHIGVPLTLLSLKQEHDLAIVEMGANNLNDIKELCLIAEPDFGYITNIGDAHLEGFGSREGVLKAKSELFKWVAEHGKYCFINQHDNALLQLPLPKEKIHYLNPKIQLARTESIFNIAVSYNNEVLVTQLTGSYNIDNINAAITIGEYFKISSKDIIKGITEYCPTNNRSQVIQYRQADIILDAYNANPSSMIKSIENLTSINAELKMVILGDMLELGDFEEEQHKRIITTLLNSNIDEVVLVGSAFYKVKNLLSKSGNIKSFTTTHHCKLWFDTKNISGYTILIKGSRSIELEKLISLH